MSKNRGHLSFVAQDGFVDSPLPGFAKKTPFRESLVCIVLSRNGFGQKTPHISPLTLHLPTQTLGIPQCAPGQGDGGAQKLTNDQAPNAQGNPNSEAQRERPSAFARLCPPSLAWRCGGAGIPRDRTKGGRRPDFRRTLADGGPAKTGKVRLSPAKTAFWKKHFFSGFTGSVERRTRSEGRGG
jgi:hypothetical protein